MASRPAREKPIAGYIDFDYRLVHDPGDNEYRGTAGLSGRIVVDNIAGTGLSFRFRETRAGIIAIPGHTTRPKTRSS